MRAPHRGLWQAEAGRVSCRVLVSVQCTTCRVYNRLCTSNGNQKQVCASYIIRIVTNSPPHNYGWVTACDRSERLTTSHR